MTRRERSKVKAMQEHTYVYIPIILCILTGIQTTNASALGLTCTVCSATHLDSNITCTWNTQPNVSYSPFFKLQFGTSCTSHTSWQVCSSSSDGSCEIPFLDCESTFDRFQVKVEPSNSGPQTISFYKSDIAKPLPPEDLTVQADSSKQLTVRWRMHECTDLGINTYKCQVKYTSPQNITGTSNATVDFIPESSSKKLKRLSPYTRYRVRVRCKPLLVGLWGDFTNTVEARTHASAPSRGPVVQTPEDVWLDYRKGLRNVTLEWEALSTVDYNSRVLLGYHIRVQDVRTAEVMELAVNDTGSQTYTRTLGHLKLSGYRVNITAYNEEGHSPPTSRIIPDRATRPDPPRDPVALATSDNNLQLSWQPPAEVGGIEIYIVLWCELETDASCLGQEKSMSVNGSELSVNVTDSWRPLTRYRFVVKAENSAGQSGASTAAIGYVQQGVPSSPPQNVTVQAETSTSLLVSWKPPPLQDRRGVITTYRVYYYVTPTISGQQMATVEQNVTVRIPDDSQPVQFSLSELKPFTYYTVRLSAVTSQGEGDKTLPTGARTREAAPSGPPSDVRIYDVNVNNVTMSWTPPSQPNGIIRYYIIKYGDNTTATEGNHTAFILEGLEGGTNYAIRVQGCTAAETPCGPFSSAQNVETKVGVPGVVQNLLAEFEPTSGDVSISWTPPALKNGRDITYVISYRQKDVSRSDNTAVTTSTTHWTSNKPASTCSDGLELLFTVHARTRDPETGQVFDGPSSTVYLSCDDRPGTAPSSGDMHRARLTLEAKVGIILAVLIACLGGIAALVPQCRKMYKKTNNVPGPADFISDPNQGTYYTIPDGPQTLNNLQIISEQSGKTPEVLDDFSKLRVERQWSHDSAFGSDYGNNNVDLDLAEKKAHYSVGGSSSGYSDVSDENAALQPDASKEKNSLSNNQEGDVADYSKLADVDSNFKDLKVNYVKQDLKTVSPKGSKSSLDNLETITDYSKVAGKKDHRKDLDVNYVRNTGTSGNKPKDVHRTEESSRKHADIPYRENPVPAKCKTVDPDSVVYVTV
ncbi:PREDICTED: phosphatidylinositol phosphatase PTPRQ-like isoform X2 [Branchiostoma belcheri]|uniref:Phosphatidylinositol phosphatase PTPRQ-like isoform X2 n=1 Tax=Branchiostoma belcheri TaxID=7741 RepID=A0A6P4Z4C3_BRABE|nr:PREDICTED: phosphatidylinositol phosphatase PTPRQ-like isoform X2 [Branchiostoma belcheri]